MASRPQRVRLPVRRYGYDDELDSESDFDDLNSNADEEARIEEDISDQSSDRDSKENMDMDVIPDSRDHSQWNFVDSENDSRLHEIPSFTKDARLKVDIPEEPEYFAFLLLDEEVFQSIALWTNSRAARRNYSSHTRNGNRNHTVGWTDISAADARKLFAMLLIMGSVKKPHIRQYFSTNPLIATPFFTGTHTFSRDKFGLIFSNL